MARSRLQQDTQVLKSLTYSDTKPAGPSLESGAVHLEDDLNAVRSQLKRVIFDDGVGNWYADIPTVNGKKRAIFDLNTDLDSLERKKVLNRVAVLTDITVPGGQNWKILSVAGSEAPPVVAAVALTTDGAVVAQSGLSGAAFNSHESIFVAGPNAINVKNLILLRSASDGSSISSAGRTVFGLLQYEGTGIDGAAFNDAAGGNRAKISFMRLTVGRDGLEVCPVSDIQGRVFNYAFVKRTQLDAITESDWLDDPAGASGGGGISALDHRTLLQLIHFIDGGPAEGFASGATRTTTGTVAPSQILWRRADTTKLVEKNLTYSGIFPTTIQWKIYDNDGSTVLGTVTDTIAYSGAFETGRTRVIA